MKQWYEELFENYARTYDREVFTQGTIGEVDFIEAEIDHDRDKTLLDIGCGTGRHAIELARRGYRVTGIDLSESQLARAREKAKEAGVKVTFLKKDARDFHFEPPFDLAIMICEGAFSLMETDEMNYKILQNAYRSIRPGGKFIFTCLNALFPLYHSVKDFLNADAVGTRTDELTFDLMTFREKSTTTFTDDSGQTKTIACDERYFAPAEIRWYLKSIGFTKIDIFGSRLGAFSRNDPMTTDDYEMLIVGER